MTKTYIGLSTSPHDPALAIVNSSGDVVFAEAAERNLQNKRACNSAPDDVVYIEELIREYCEKGTDLVIATSWQNRFRTRIRFITSVLLPLLKGFFDPWFYRAVLMLSRGLLANYEQAGTNLEFRYSETNPGAQITRRQYNHHLCHAAAAAFTSPFNEAVCAVMDGFGESASTAFFSYTNGRLSTVKGIKPSTSWSPGLYYAYLCKLCGFDPIKGEEWKVMGLAPYGSFNEEIYQFVQTLTNIKKDRFYLPRCYSGDTSAFTREPHEPVLKAADLACTGQAWFGEMFTRLLSRLHEIAPSPASDNLILAGGCALNSSYNGQLLEKTPFKNLHVFSAPADDGNALGAALLAYYEDNPPEKARAQILSPYLGSRVRLETLDSVETHGKLKNRLSRKKTVHEQAAKLIAGGKIIGWVQGRAEFGPRALGNRSILADPRLSNIKEIINSRVKFREEYRPFAPSILHEYGGEYFEEYRASPYMEMTLRFKKDVIDRVPGVVHVDGTGRVQSVSPEWNENFYKLIKEFYSISGVPIVLNTSFNVMGKPIIHSVEDALAVFFSTGLDALVIEDRVYVK